MSEAKTPKEQGEEFGRDFSNFLNTMGSDRQKAAIEVMLRDHRSLQQNTMRFFMMFVEGMAKNGHDLRNEASVELAKAILSLPERTRILPRV